jgi:hypothetical protein
MVDSDFWRDLAEKFVELGADGDFRLYVTAEKGTELNRMSSWQLISSRDIGLSYLTRYDTLARRGAMKLPDEGSDLLDKWLNAIEKRIPHAVTERATGRYIVHLYSQSANLCRMFESVALEAEHHGMVRIPPATVPVEAERSCTRSAQVSAFLVACNRSCQTRLRRRHIWLLVGHARGRQFEYWQACSEKATAGDNRNFVRVLGLSPEDFIDQLKRKHLIP